MSDRVTDSEDDGLQRVLDIRRKLIFSLKSINNLKNMLHEYENRDHDKSINTIKESR